MATEDGNHSAHEVSDAFVKQYFRILRQFPEEARRLYVSDSVVSRPGIDGTMMSFTSLETINDQILSCEYKSAMFEVISVDSQNSFESGIFIMVIGFITGKDKVRKKFSQSFYLARQNNAYVVLNDILRYVGDESSGPADLSVSNSMPVNELAKPAVELNQIKPVQELDASELAKPVVELNQTKPVQELVASVEPSKDVAEVTPLENGTSQNSDAGAETVEKPTEPVTEAIAPKALPDSAKRSFAAIVQSMAQNAAPFKAPAMKPKPMGHPRAAAAMPQAHGSVINAEKKNEQKIIEEPGTSIFVANLPMNAMPADLLGMFKDFGPIKENGIQVRSSRSTGICFGFVAFESTSSVQSVLQAAKLSPFTLGDRKLRVKEKQVEYDGSKGSGRNGGGMSKTQNGSTNGGDFKRRDNSNRINKNGGRNGHEKRGDRHSNVDERTNGEGNKEGEVAAIDA